MTPCTLPAIPAAGTLETRYVHGVECIWHGSICEAATRDTGEPCCPHCGGLLGEYVSESHFWTMVRAQERKLPRYEAMLRWSRRLCFPDFDTLQNAFRQSMTGDEDSPSPASEVQ